MLNSYDTEKLLGIQRVDEIKSASPIPTKSDFIAKRFHPTQVGFLPTKADLVPAR